MNGSPHPAPADGPITPDLIADLQAGLLDDDTAARLRHRIRNEPDAAAALAALDRVRRDLAALGTDPATAPIPPRHATERVNTTLRHLEARPRRRLHTIGLVVGACAALVAVGLGTAALLHTPAAAPRHTAGINRLTQPPPGRDVGLSEQQILSLLATTPDLGPLSDPQLRADCLAGLGYPPGLMVLGGRPVVTGNLQGIVLLVPADTPNTVVALVVTPECSARHAGLLAQTSVTRPVTQPVKRP